MKHKSLAFAALAAVTLAAGAEARTVRRHGFTMSGGRSGVTRCSDWHVAFDDRDAAVADEHLTIRAADAAPLVASPSENGGITVIGSDGPDFEIDACKAADDESLLGRVHLVRHGATIAVEGPGDEEWTAQLIIRAPKNSSVQLDARNGPANLSNFAGKATVTSENGPVRLRRSSGDIDVRTTNGPIDVDGGSGRFRLRAENGPLSVRLQSTSWQGGDLEGSTQNGPVHLDLGENFTSGVIVETAGRSPVHCGGEACKNARRNWNDGGKSIAFGAESAVIRLSTENGPVSIAGD